MEVEKVENVNPMETKAAAREVVDEVCLDSEYESGKPEDPNAKPNSVEVPANHPKAPPVRDRSLGGIDYYTVTYEDPTDDGDDDIYYFLLVQYFSVSITCFSDEWDIIKI